MQPVESDTLISPTPFSRSNALRLVPVGLRRTGSRFVVAVCVLAAFAGGFGVASLMRPPAHSKEIRAQVADFYAVVPDGQTTITVFDSQSEPVEIGRLNIQRNGDDIQGIPQTERRILPRARLSAEDAAFFRHEIEGVISSSDSTWQRANKIRSWLNHTPHRTAMPGLATRVAREAYEQMRHGRPVLCGNLAEIYVALCEAAGLTARTVGLSAMVRNGRFGIDSHSAAEVWLPEMGGWIYQDPLFDCYWEVNGKPASALSLHDALMNGVSIKFAPDNAHTESALCDNDIDPRLYFRHISYEYKPGGALLYFADKRLEPLSLSDRNWIQTSNRTDLEKLDTAGNTIVERHGEIVPGIFFQLLGSDLFIRDRREARQSLRVRSSSGTVQGCAYVHQRAEDLGLFSGTNLARNPSFRLANNSGGIANEWSVTGPVEVATVAGGQAMAAQAGGRLWQRVQVRPHGRYLLYARVSVARGLVLWSIGDAAHGRQSVGTIEPERVSEVVSDVIESDSGYLDVGFEVPSGGAFRVMDVIISEAPRFVQ